MKFFIIVLAVLGSPWIFAVLRFLCKRIVLTVRVKRLCKKTNARLVKCGLLWWLGLRILSKCDFYLELDREIYSVKLFELLYRQSVLCFTWEDSFFIRSFMGFLGWGGRVLYTFNGKKKPVPRYDFRYRFEDEWELKNPHNILLVNPVCMEIRYVGRNGDERIVGTGEFIGDIEIQTLSRLAEKISADRRMPE